MSENNPSKMDLMNTNSNMFHNSFPLCHDNDNAFPTNTELKKKKYSNDQGAGVPKECWLIVPPLLREVNGMTYEVVSERIYACYTRGMVHTMFTVVNDGGSYCSAFMKGDDSAYSTLRNYLKENSLPQDCPLVPQRKDPTTTEYTLLKQAVTTVRESKNNLYEQAAQTLCLLSEYESLSKSHLIHPRVLEVFSRLLLCGNSTCAHFTLKALKNILKFSSLPSDNDVKPAVMRLGKDIEDPHIRIAVRTLDGGIPPQCLLLRKEVGEVLKLL
eukprot:CAMPEP_0185024828 /NCGR_PEP_ID=MMETSP1103-20130426/8023_1 /TAXON_ID=36769 /ORGANISM="Paraphysomonas bandaiensis, Strain Caron Lab Isolate" /LENGTH=270 /DNA_ID=CAMNT_0027557893 /DNA_START=75 /DNA_END=887 /DNA_ORIENTATION=+